MTKKLIPLICLLISPTLFANECVILLHGLARTADSMQKLEQKLGEADFTVVNVDYPSREKPIDALADIAVGDGIAQCEELEARPINFVTHSLGGILVRQYFSTHEPDQLKRVVMLGPPNQGSEVVDTLKDVPGYELLNGPAGMQLGTETTSVPNSLGPVNFDLGVIAGTQSINLILSAMIPDQDDGKVSVERAQVEGMCSFVALPVTHPLMMKNDEVIDEVITFLKGGQFSNITADNYCKNVEKIGSR